MAPVASFEAVQRCAYFIWEERVADDLSGDALQDWLEAEAEFQIVPARPLEADLPGLDPALGVSLESERAIERELRPADRQTESADEPTAFSADGTV